MKIGSREFFPGKRLYVMGILNVTPDSFSDGGKYTDTQAAAARAEKMIAEAADIIDVGGESTRPGYVPVTAHEEIRRILPVIRELSCLDIPVSVDTYKSEVAAAALEAGADMINDIWGFRADEEMAAVAAEYDVPVCLMHNRENTEYKDFVAEVIEDLRISLDIARRHGVREENILLDPGIGFGKTYEQNLLMMRNLRRVADLGYPVLLGVSRKSMIGKTLDLPVTEREEGTIAANVTGAMMGCSFFRVHDVKGNARALKMAEAILYKDI